MFEPIFTQGGWLYRLRLVGGVVKSEQLSAILDWLEAGELEITRRANLQYRSFVVVDPGVLQRLQSLGLIGNKLTDHLRNLMVSPLAGIDRGGVDLSFLVSEWEQYLYEHQELQDLSPKFSVGFDGSEALSIGCLGNDILVRAIDRCWGAVFLGVNQGIVVPADKFMDVLKTIAIIYLHYTKKKEGRPRLKEMVAELGIENLWQTIEKKHHTTYDRCDRPAKKPDNHQSIYPQNDPDYQCLVLSVPFGRLSKQVLQNIKEISQQFGRGEVRFSPWQSIFIPFVHQSCLRECRKTIDDLGLSYKESYITACAGLACNSSFTDTQADAQKLTQQKEGDFSLHLSGCPKLCAYTIAHDFLAIGTKPGTYALYHKQQPIGECTPQELLTIVNHFL